MCQPRSFREENSVACMQTLKTGADFEGVFTDCCGEGGGGGGLCMAYYMCLCGEIRKESSVSSPGNEWARETTH